jgi:hypothetical protein
MRVLKCEEPNPELNQRLSQILKNSLNHNQGFVQFKKKLELGLEVLVESRNLNNSSTNQVLGKSSDKYSIDYQPGLGFILNCSVVKDKLRSCITRSCIHPPFVAVNHLMIRK